MHKKHMFLRVFQKNRLFACVFCVFFASSALASLPAGFTELEYIESTGTQYIDTGLNVYSNNLKVEMGYDVAVGGLKNMWGFAASSGDTNWFNPYTEADNFYIGTTRSLFSLGIGQSGVKKDIIVEAIDDNKVRYAVNGNFSDWYIYSGSFTNGQHGNFMLFTTGATPNFIKTRKASGMFWYARIYQDNILVRNLIPARRDSDNTVGMYDITNSGKNLFDKNIAFSTIYVTDTATRFGWEIEVPAGTYNVSGSTTNVVYTKSVVNGVYGSAQTFNEVGGRTLTLESAGKILIYASGDTYLEPNLYMLVEGSTAPTSYEPYPFYTNAGTGTFVAGPKKSISDIQIATTKFVDDEFKAAEDQLATTVQTIENVVSRTIAQTGQIQILQDTKQTRPDESCPANMKCLLVQDEDGTPHWYPIIEP